MDQPINMLRMQIGMDLALARSGAITDVPTIAASVERMTYLFGDSLSERTIAEEVGEAFDKAHLDATGHPWPGKNYASINGRIVELPGYGYTHESGGTKS